MAVTVVIPCFNEAATIGNLLTQIPRTIGGHAVTVIVIDDRSTDATVERIERVRATLAPNGCSRVRFLQQSTNQGKGAALRRAMGAADDCDALAWMDSDGQHLATSLPDLLGRVLDDGIDLCVGSRYLTTANRQPAPFNRRIVRHFAVRAVRKITKFEVTDPFSGLRCFSRRALNALQLEGDEYEAELESCFSIARAGLRYGEIAIPRIYGPGTSKMGHARGAVRGRLAVVVGYARTVRTAREHSLTTDWIATHG
jgi:dolichol-phosphate mannosyltransferase